MKKVIKACNILLPNAYADYEKWAVVACDQYTSEEEYWQHLRSYIDEPSSLDLIFPEVYLNKIDLDNKIKDINKNMDLLLQDNFFSEYKNSFILVERKVNGFDRFGLVCAIDLDAYDFDPNKKALIRATEKTVVERLPIRTKIRKNASLELSHILVLISDEKKEIIEKLKQERYSFKQLYSFELNMNGGYIYGYLINDKDTKDYINSKLNDLISDNLLALVGDGNHSLASAKMHWENIKKNLSKEKQENHKARYALVELENIFDEGLHFEPIHRIIYNVGDNFLKAFKENIKGESKSIVYNGDKIEYININNNAIEAIKEIQDFLDDYLSKNDNISIDYIHGEENLKKIALEKNAIGIVMPRIKKEEFFEYVKENGILPRKTFSLGEANEKRYYLEARKIK